MNLLSSIESKEQKHRLSVAGIGNRKIVSVVNTPIIKEKHNINKEKRFTFWSTENITINQLNFV